jgi:hypothetical protein
LDRLSKALEEKLAIVNYIPGTFDLEEAIDVLGNACLLHYLFFYWKQKYLNAFISLSA